MEGTVTPWQPNISRFIGNFTRFLAHGLKNRLSPAVTYTRMLLESPDMAAEKRTRLLEYIEKALQEALKVCNAMELFSRIESGASREMDVHEWIVALSRKALIEADVQTVAKTGTKAYVDTSLWDHILLEVFKNIADHGGGKAKVQWTLQRRRLQVVIEDQGPGLGKVNVEDVLPPTRRGPHSLGTGFGLSTAGWAVLLLEGDLHLESLPEGGMRVSITALTAQPATSPVAGIPN